MHAGKSVTATLAAQLMHSKYLDVGLDDPAPIPAWHREAEDPRARITMRHLFQMSSGLRFSGASHTLNCIFRVSLPV